MKRFRFTAALLLALGAVSAPASATIVSPAPGTPVTAAGSINYRANVIDTACDWSFDGTVSSSTTVRVVSGSSTNCGVGTMTFESLPATKTLLVVAGQLTNEWSLPLTIRYVIPIYGTCWYQTTLAGTWTSDGFDTHLTLWVSGRLASIRLLSGSSPLCSATPAITGEITLFEVAAE